MVVAAAVLCVCVYMRGCICELDVYKDLCGSKQEKKSLKHMKGLRFFKLTEKQTRKQSTTVNIMRIHHDFISIMDA